MMRIDNAKAQMRNAILDYCVLLILSRGDAYSAELVSQLKNAEMIVVEGTLYPILNRHQTQGLLSYRWEESLQGPPRKYYSLTPKGHEYLALLNEAWSELVEQINLIRESK